MRKNFVLIIISFSLILFHFFCKNTKVDESYEIGVLLGNMAKDFIEKESKGNNFSLDSLKGKVILLNFSTMWCGPCRIETPELINIYNKYKNEGFEIVQCIYQNENSDPADQDDINRWVQEFKMNFIVINDPDRSTVDEYQFNYVPFNLIISKDFIIRYRMAGFNESSIIQKIEELL